MITTTYVTTMARYNAWMNGRLYGVCAEVDDAERNKARGLFFGSIHATLNHLLYGDRVWLSRFLGTEVDLPPPGTELHREFAPLRRAREACDDNIIGWALSVDGSWLSEDLSFTSKVDGVTRTHPAWRWWGSRLTRTRMMLSDSFPVLA